MLLLLYLVEFMYTTYLILYFVCVFFFNWMLLTNCVFAIIIFLLHKENLHHMNHLRLLVGWKRCIFSTFLQNGRIPCDVDVERLTLNEGYINGSHHVSSCCSPAL